MAEDGDARAEIVELLRPKGADEVAAAFVARYTLGALMRRSLPPEERLLGSLVTRTTRMWLVGSTGAGKTMIGLAIAGGMATGTGFLNWRSSRKARVLYIDGEMALPMLQARGRDLARRLGEDEDVRELVLFSSQDAEAEGALLGAWAPLNTEEGKLCILRLCDLVRPDVVIFDNLQALVSGELKEEGPWIDTKPLVEAITRRRIGQIWIDHTGHNQERQYGTSLKAWQFDTVGIINPSSRDECAPGELSFTLSFDAPYGKARNRSPDTWTEYAAQTIKLSDDEWTSSAKPVPGHRAKLAPGELTAFRILLRELDEHGTEATVFDNGTSGLTVAVKLWRARFYREGMPDAEQDTRKRAFSRAVRGLLDKEWIGTRDDLVWPLPGKR